MRWELLTLTHPTFSPPRSPSVLADLSQHGGNLPLPSLHTVGQHCCLRQSGALLAGTRMPYGMFAKPCANTSSLCQLRATLGWRPNCSYVSTDVDSFLHVSEQIWQHLPWQECYSQCLDISKAWQKEGMQNSCLKYAHWKSPHSRQRSWAIAKSDSLSLERSHLNKVSFQLYSLLEQAAPLKLFAVLPTLLGQSIPLQVLLCGSCLQNSWPLPHT